MISSYARFQGYKENFVHVPTSCTRVFPYPTRTWEWGQTALKSNCGQFPLWCFLGVFWVLPLCIQKFSLSMNLNVT